MCAAVRDSAPTARAVASSATGQRAGRGRGCMGTVVLQEADRMAVPTTAEPAPGRHRTGQARYKARTPDFQVAVRVLRPGSAARAWSAAAWYRPSRIAANVSTAVVSVVAARPVSPSV